MAWTNPFQAFNPYGAQNVVEPYFDANNWGNFFNILGNDVNNVAVQDPASQTSGGGVDGNSGGNPMSYVGMPTSVLPSAGGGVPAADPHKGMIQLPNGQWVDAAAFQSMLSSGGVGGGGGISAYQQQTIDLEKQKEADQKAYWDNLIADAQAKNDLQKNVDESNAINSFNKDWMDYQNNHYYGSMNGAGFLAPQGGGSFIKMPEPYFVQQYYKDHPDQQDPFSQQAQYAGYSGSQFMNPQHQGLAAAPAAPLGAAPANTDAGAGHVPYGPELTGASGYGSLITQNGTPVAMSAWQARHLDPTSVEHYGSYVHDIAGWNPKDLYNVNGVTPTDFNQPPSDGTMNLKAPLGFSSVNNPTTQ